MGFTALVLVDAYAIERPRESILRLLATYSVASWIATWSFSPTCCNHFSPQSFKRFRLVKCKKLLKSQKCQEDLSVGSMMTN